MAGSCAEEKGNPGGSREWCVLSEGLVLQLHCLMVGRGRDTEMWPGERQKVLGEVSEVRVSVVCDFWKSDGEVKVEREQGEVVQHFQSRKSFVF